MSQSAACCSVPAVQSQGYKEKGEYITAGDLKTYATGQQDAKYGLLVIYDIFGFYPQTLQGADILATGDKERPYKVFMPDFFEGKPADISWYPPKNKDHEEKLGKFFSTAAEPQKTLKALDQTVTDLKKQYPDIKTWGIIGFCWGGKIANLASLNDTIFKAGASAHPAMVDADDAAKLKIPYALLASKDEDKEAVGKWQSAIKVKHLVETFPDQVHGWMAARSALDDPKVKQEYERGYKMLLEFFCENL